MAAQPAIILDLQGFAPFSVSGSTAAAQSAAIATARDDIIQGLFASLHALSCRTATTSSSKKSASKSVGSGIQPPRRKEALW